MKAKINKFVMNNPINFIIFMVVYVCCYALFPISQLVSLLHLSNYGFVISLIVRALFAIYPIVVFICIDRESFQNKINYGYILVLLYFIVCINNFPFVTLIQNRLSFTITFPKLFIHIINCFTVSIFEEIIFRGVIFCLLLKIFNNKKYKLLYSILMNSFIFGVVHFVNIFSGQPFIFVLMMVGYSMLTGAMFSIVYYVTKNIIIAVLLHFVYNFCGMFSDAGLISGEYWTSMQIIYTAILAVLVCIISVLVIIKFLRSQNESGSSKS